MMDVFLLSMFNKATLGTRSFVGLISKEANAATKCLSEDQVGRVAIVIALIYLGIALLRFTFGIIKFIFIYFLRPAKNLKSYGSWAVVTGATDGIGKAYCVELAKKGLNLVVISRTQSRLDDLASELQSTHGIQVTTCAADLTTLDETTIARLGATITNLDIGILINNAGMSYDHPEYLEQTSLATNSSLITINTTAPTLLAQLLLLGMKERGRGVIVNIGSANGLLPSVPLLSVYAGTKAYINQLTRSLDTETSNFGVRVHDQCPMFVATKMSKIKRARLDAPTPEVWARAAVRQIGYETVLTPYWYHGVMTAVVDTFAPQFIVRKYVHDLHKAFRAAFYRRQAREAAAAAAGAGGASGAFEAKKSR